MMFQIKSLMIAMVLSVLGFTINLAHANEDVMEGIKATDSYISGGIGSEEVDYFHNHAKAYPLHILYSQGKIGFSLTEVALRIADTHGKVVLEVEQSGPRLYAKIPPGKYKITATFNGKKQSTFVELLPNKTERVFLNWKGDPQVDESELKD